MDSLGFGSPGFKSSQSNCSDPQSPHLCCSMGVMTPHSYNNLRGIRDAACKGPGKCQYRGGGQRVVKGSYKSGASSLPCCPSPLMPPPLRRADCSAGIPRGDSSPRRWALFPSLCLARKLYLRTFAELLPPQANRKSLTSRQAGRGCQARLHAQGLWSGQGAGCPLGPRAGMVGWVGNPWAWQGEVGQSLCWRGLWGRSQFPPPVPIQATWPLSWCPPCLCPGILPPEF